MEAVTYTSLRKNLSGIMDKIEEDRVVCRITRKNHSTMVMLPEEDYNALAETLHLLSTPANALALQVSMEQARNEEFVEVDWKHGG